MLSDAFSLFDKLGAIGTVVLALWLSHKSLAAKVLDLSSRISRLEEKLMNGVHWK